MLVISRKIGEKLVIGDDIEIVVSKIAGLRVTLGIEAPKHVRVRRGEIQPHTRLDRIGEPATIDSAKESV